ncbi:MAG TPA: CDP-diacylglycerol--serine O-phosphatidyltransferase [Verrucomicrobiales bacterium]|nr:CDP-diacylglycerol--serine O-phosphatidyltransferase [Verrucomicrobiales bacterium]
MSDREIKVYLWPNLMTAGNLFCGFAAILSIFAGMRQGGMAAAAAADAQIWRHYIQAIALIFGACLFDLLDGRVARISGQESAFGREFDSLADIVSFGLAPALLVMDIVLYEFQNGIGEIIAFIYLLCGAMRLARFNAHAGKDAFEQPAGHFSGFPIPAAAGVIASLTLLILWLGTDRPEVLGRVKYVLPFLMLLLSFMMFSRIQYPSFKKLNWRTQRSVPAVAGIILLMVVTVRFWRFMPAALFTLYLLYGLARPWVSRRWRQELGDELEEGEDEWESAAGPPLPKGRGTEEPEKEGA